MTKEEMERCFPKLKRQGYDVTSPYDDGYNCISFAAEDEERRWWWPSNSGDAYWPPGVEPQATLDGFVQAFRTLGYEECDDGAHEQGYQKVALYADVRGMPTHAARQLTDGTWVSKLGKCEDIRHEEAGAVEDTATSRTAYGRVVRFLRRARR